MSDKTFKALLVQMHQAGERLRLAMAEEDRLLGMLSRFPADENISRQWAEARHQVERFQTEYLDAVAACKRSQKGAEGAE
ncbi:MAG TPA: hypothetical protein VKV17_06270 [Bryobacteraceae bacterium]|nr:hypothetical protein [Bryobacteraceae bacterium]